MEAMQATRAALQRDHCVETDLHADLLATQRRAVYARIDSSAGWISKFPIRRWVITACGVVMVSTGAWVWEHSTNLKQPGILEIQRARLSDEQLVYEASEVAERAEPKAAAPIQALFEN
jgi:hypothetical protein